MMEFALRIKTLREYNNLSQKQLAQIFDIAASTVGMWESHERIPPASLLLKIADYFNVSLDYLLGRANDGNGFNKNLKNINSVVFYCNGAITDSIELTETKMNLAKKIILDIQNS